MSRYDYLVIGSGASGLAFVDTLIAQKPDSRVLIVDKHDRPGGHWNDAYSFVTLHQPSAFYGVSSMELSSGLIDEIGLNKGLHELATGAEVSSYFDRVMRTRRTRVWPRAPRFPLISSGLCATACCLPARSNIAP